MNYRALQHEARRYYALVAEARRLGIPVALDDPRSPQTVAELRESVKVARHG